MVNMVNMLKMNNPLSDTHRWQCHMSFLEEYSVARAVLLQGGGVPCLFSQYRTEWKRYLVHIRIISAVYNTPSTQHIYGVQDVFSILYGTIHLQYIVKYIFLKDPILANLQGIILRLVKYSEHI